MFTVDTAYSSISLPTYDGHAKKDVKSAVYISCLRHFTQISEQIYYLLAC